MRRWIRVSSLVSAIILGLIILTSLTGTNYVYTALWYNFADIDDHKIFDNRIIPAGDPQPWPLSSRYGDLVLPDDLLKDLDALQTIAFLVVQQDSLRYENYWAEGDRERISNSFSVAKSVVNMLTGIALEQGKLKSIDQPIGDFLPVFARGEKAKITIRHLLTMSSGLDWEEAYVMPISHTTEAYYGTDMPATIAKLAVEVEPGTQFRYKSGDTQILSMVLSKAIGRSLSEFASANLWQLIGAETNALWSLDKKDGFEKSFCCLHATARDFARLGQLYLHGGNWKGRQVVPATFVKQSLQPLSLPNTTGQPANYYGYQWWLLHNDTGKVFYARGILGQYVMVMPEKKAVIVRLGHKRDEKKDNHPMEVKRIVRAMRQVL